MPASAHVTVRIDLNVVRQNVERIRQLTRTPIIAVVKADAYGLGIEPVTRAIHELVESWCVFSLAEAATAQLYQRTGKSSLSLGPDGPADDPAEWIEHRVRPAVWDVDRATALRAAHPALSVDTGMQRFACPADQIEAVLKAGACPDAFTHATSLDRVQRLQELVGGRGLRLHAAGSSLLDEPAARLDAVRPGLAMYRGAVRVSTRLVEAHDTKGPAGYSGFVAPRHGVIVAGYSNHLRPGAPCLINGRHSRILEVGMQSAFVELGPNDQAGDEVVLLGHGLTEADIAAAWQTSPHEALFRLCGSGERTYDR